MEQEFKYAWLNINTGAQKLQQLQDKLRELHYDCGFRHLNSRIDAGLAVTTTL